MKERSLEDSPPNIISEIECKVSRKSRKKSNQETLPIEETMGERKKERRKERENWNSSKWREWEESEGVRTFSGRERVEIYFVGEEEKDRQVNDSIQWKEWFEE